MFVIWGNFEEQIPKIYNKNGQSNWENVLPLENFSSNSEFKPHK